jgi:acyl carrier protein
MAEAKNRSEVASDVDRVIKSRLPLYMRGIEITEDMPLLGEGLGLDSVGLVELFLKLEEYFGIPFPVELIEKEPLTVGVIIDHAFNALGRFS